MKYRALGRSGLVVSTRALGTMTFGSETDEEAARQQLALYADKGGTLIETADVYSGGLSEQIVGRWLGTLPAETRDRLVIAGKGRFPVGVDPRDSGLSRRHLTRALDASLRRLGVEQIDLYQVHSWDPVTPIDETLAFLEDAVHRGKIAYAGLSNFIGWQIAGTAALVGSRFPLVSMQPQYNLLNREAEWEIIPAATAHGLGILPWSPLAGGWLTGKYSRDHRPTGATRLGEDPSRGTEAYDLRAVQERTWRVLDAVLTIAERHGCAPAAVALAWLDARPGVTSIILGARTTEQLEQTIDTGLTLSESETSELDAASDPEPANWPYGPAGVEQRSRVID